MAKINPKALFANKYLKDWRENGQIKYVATDKIDEGGYGAVFECYLNSNPNMRVAAKIAMHDVDDGTVERFRSENEFLKYASHPNIIKHIDYAEVERRPILIMELGSTNLDALITNPKINFKIKDMLWIINDISSALEYTHSQSDPTGDPRTHKDVKPSNAILVPDPTSKRIINGMKGVFKQSDFGSIRPGANASSSHGTYSYRSLEAFFNEFSPKADIYSLGVMVYDMLTKTDLFPAAFDMDTILKLKKDENYIFNKCKDYKLSKEVTDLIVNSTRKFKEERYSMEQFRERLLALDPSFKVDKKVQKSAAEKEMELMLSNFSSLLMPAIGEYGLRTFKNVDELMTAKEHLETHAKTHSLNGISDFIKSVASYETVMNAEKRNIEGLVESISSEIADSGFRPNDDFRKKFRHVTAAVHILGMGYEKASYEQYRNGVIDRHIDNHLQQNDDVFNG